MLNKLLHADSQLHVGLVVVSHELERDIELLRNLTWKSQLVWHLSCLDVLWSGGETGDLDFIVKAVRSTVAVNSHDLNLLLILR